MFLTLILATKRHGTSEHLKATNCALHRRTLKFGPRKAYPTALELATLGTAATAVARLLASLYPRQIGVDVKWPIFYALFVMN